MRRKDRRAAKASRQHVRPCIPGLTLRTKRWIEVEGSFAIGDGGGELLQAIDGEGSLASAARSLGWSYRHAWGYLRRAETVLGISLVATRAGKGSARGAVLTGEAKAIIAILRRA